MYTFGVHIETQPLHISISQAMSSLWHHALHLLEAAQQMALRTDQINWGGAIQAIHRCAKGATKSYPAAGGCFYGQMLVIFGYIW